MSRQVLYYNGEVACEKLHGYCQQYDTEEFTNYEYYLFTQYFSILVMEDKTMKAKIMLINSPIMMLITAYSARNDSRAVKAPGPAIRGNAIGTIETPEPVFSVFIISTPNIISKANMNITKAPATAKDSTSTLKSLNSPLPAKRRQ